MKVFLDANVLVAVLNKEYPLFSHASRILSLADDPLFDLFTSPVCMAIAFYFAEKKHKTRLARQKIRLLSRHLSIASVNETTVRKTVENAKINDFEDGLEYYAALESKCTCIITEDTGDFYFSSIEVLNCENFLKKLLTYRK